MSLVRELEAKRAIGRRQLIEAGTKYLLSVGVAAVQEEESGIDMFGADIDEPVIRLKGESIDRMRLISTDFISCGMLGNVSRFQYEISIDNKFTAESKKRIAARTKLIKEKKALGLFGGKVTGIDWVGRDLAELLNHDSEISKVLLECAKSLGNPEFRIQLKSPTTAVILGPSFVEPERITDLFKLGLKESFEECVFGYKICSRIAKHLKELVRAE